jgi:DNA-binding response OmpR family regulator/chromosome segregation ATPase
MSTKVLVFESDAGFAGELRSELGKLGCTTSVVDDGNVGLQHASTEKPDLILLSIELPRMNGFSVCNKLKKDPNLKEVPLIIMSSESSDETFEQHKKLRTRAEDYVHKPIGFGQLLEHIQAFVPLGATPDSEAAIVIDDEIEIGSADYYSDDDGTVVAPRSAAVDAALAEAASRKVDADVDAFAESAFGMLTSTNGASETVVTAQAPPLPPLPLAAPSRRASMPPTPPRVAPSVRPSADHHVSVDAAEYERVREELAKIREELSRSRDEHARGRDEQAKLRDHAGQVERELADLHGEVDRLREEAGEAERLTKEVEDLKARIAAGPKAGAVSSREFLDLREALNKKDKEILTLREQLSRKDKEIVESQDKMISLERGQADLEDRSLATERELAETREKIETLTADKDLAKKLGDDLKLRLEKSRAEIESRDRQLADARARHAEELSARDAKIAEVKAQAEEALDAERTHLASEIAQTEERRKAELEQASRQYEASLADALEHAGREKSQALASQESQLQQEHENKVLALRGSHREELERSLRQADEEGERKEREALSSLRAEHAQRVAGLESEREAKIASLEQKAAGERTEAESRIAKLDMDLSATRGELESLRQAREAADAATELKLLDLSNRLAESVAAREEIAKELEKSAQRASALEGDLSSTRQELGSTQQKLAAESTRAERSTAKWEADKHSLERAKDALAVALAQIEEAESRALT